MPTTVVWAPNQGAVAQVVTGTCVVPTSIGNTYSVTINGKIVTYSSILADTAALAATGLYTLLAASTIPEFTEISWANPSAGVITATASTAGTPFSLTFSTGNGLAGGITQVTTTSNASPSDIYDAQNWLRFIDNVGGAGVRQLPQNGDDMVLANSAVSMLWNLAALAAVTLNSITRWQSMTGAIGLPETNPLGYTEWRATYFKFSGPTGSVPSGGLAIVLGQGTGNGPPRERYDAGSSPVTLTILATGSSADAFGVRFLGLHTANAITVLGGASLGVAMLPGEVANIGALTIDGGATLGIGEGVTWTAGTTLYTFGGAVLLYSAPAVISGANGTQFTFAKHSLTWATITLQGNCPMTWLCGGIITTLTMSQGCSLDKSFDARGLTITNHTMDGDTCYINDPLNAITYTNAGVVKQSVTQGPYRFTGTKTVRVV